VTYVDVNHDGKKETIADVYCTGSGTFTTSQVVAFYRDKKGTIRTFGRGTAQTGAVAGICDLRTGPGNTLLRQANGHYRGSMTVTVRNLSTATIPYKTMTFVTSDMQASASSGYTAEDDPYGGGMKAIRCTGAPIPGGATRTVTLTFDVPRRIDGFGFEPGSNLVIPGNYGDLNSSNDQVKFKILFQG
jgi:hypothetical protein